MQRSAARGSQPGGIVVVAASAGGVQALRVLVSGLGVDFPLPVVVVQHLAPRHHSLLPEILARRTTMTVETAAEGQRLQPGTVYIAPPGRHVVVHRDGTLSLSDDPPVHFVRPSADVLFASAASAYGSTTIAVVMTGTGEDGADGVRRVKEHGGTVIAQDEASADYFGMPAAAIATGGVDRIVPLSEISATLVGLSTAAQAS